MHCSRPAGQPASVMCYDVCFLQSSPVYTVVWGIEYTPETIIKITQNRLKNVNVFLGYFIIFVKSIEIRSYHRSFHFL